MDRADLEHHLAGPRARVCAICRLGAQHLDADLPKIVHFAVAKNPATACQDRLGHTFGLGRGINRGQCQGRDRAPAIGMGRRHLVAVGAPKPPAALDQHPVGSDLFQGDPGPVADHVGQQVGARVPDFIEHLLSD